MPRLKIGCDVDGVLANFSGEFRQVINKLYNLNIQDDPADWEMSNWGLSKEQMDVAWKQVSTTSDFWTRLSLLPDVHMADTFKLEQNAQLFFITNRLSTFGMPLEKQTAFWLKVKCWIQYPTVIVTKNKGRVASALDLDAFIDDYYSNLEDIHLHSPSTKLYYKMSTYSVEPSIPVTPIHKFSDFVTEVLNG